MKSLLIAKLKAAAVHLTLSILVAGTILLLCAWLWYPTLLLSPTGATKIFLIVLSVDICLGPFLTLVVFNKQKTELYRDLLIIGLVQIGALAYGVYTLAMARPVYYVYAVDRFEVVQANDLSEPNIQDATLAEFKTLPIFGPKWISTRTPKGDEQQIGLTAITGGADIAQLPKYYSSLETSAGMRIERAKPIDTLKEFNPNKHGLINSIAKKYNSKGVPIAFVPLTARKKDLSVIVNSESGDVIDIVDLSPWN